jgi:hypothetical protein
MYARPAVSQLARLEMMGAQGEQEDDRDRDSDQVQEDRTHSRLLFSKGRFNVQRLA